jgi:N-acetyltransferase 10
MKTLFVFKGMNALGYEEHLDYDIAQSTNPEFNKATVSVNVFRKHWQTVQVCSLPSLVRFRCLQRKREMRSRP